MADEDIRTLLISAHERITELSLLTYALQTLLQQTGVFSSVDVEARVEELRTAFSEKFQLHLGELHEQQARERLRQLLQSYEGTKQ